MRGVATQGILFCWLSFVVSSASALSGLPQFDDLDLSPDGSHLLMIRSSGEVYDLVVRELSSGAERTLFEGDADTGLINWCRWANVERIVCGVRVYVPAPRLGQITRTRLFAINRDGSDILPLVRRARNQDRAPPQYNAQVQDRVLSWLVDDPQNILIQLNRDDPNRPAVYKLDIYRNSLSRVQRHRSHIRRWYATHDGRVTLAIGYSHTSYPMVFHVNGRKLTRFKGAAYESEIPPQPVGFSDDGEFAYMSMTNGYDRHGLYKVKVANGEVVKEVFRDPNFDVFGGIITHPDTGEPVGVSYLGHHPKLVWFEPKLARLFGAIRGALPGSQMQLISADIGYNRFILHTYGGVSPSYYLYDRKQASLELIGEDFPDLEHDQVIDLRPVNYQTRDNLTIPAYLATPEGVGPFPTILLPHGGPYARDSAEFDAWTQYLVEAGFAVMKPNYRGSVGYGEAYMQAGYKQWGLKMQEDLMDGLDWMVAQGIADPERVCVVGASYGGYSALVSAYKFADKISCAISLAGISNLSEMVTRMYSFDLAKRNRERIQKSGQLIENSPLHRVEDIQVPVLLLHGDRDTVVRVKQSRRFAEALKRHGKQHRYVEMAKGDHFLSMSSQRDEFFREMSAFLDEHLGGQ